MSGKRRVFARGEMGRKRVKGLAGTGFLNRDIKSTQYLRFYRAQTGVNP
jgi:hypothetical protein